MAGRPHRQAEASDRLLYAAGAVRIKTARWSEGFAKRALLRLDSRHVHRYHHL
jgi:hypothetical protein